MELRLCRIHYIPEHLCARTVVTVVWTICAYVSRGVAILSGKIVGVIRLVMVDSFPVNPPLSISGVWWDAYVSAIDWLRITWSASIDGNDPASTIQVVHLLLDEKDIFQLIVSVEDVCLFCEGLDFGLNLRSNGGTSCDLVVKMETTFLLDVILKEFKTKILTEHTIARRHTRIVSFSIYER